MITSLQQKIVPVTSPGPIVDNAAFTTAAIDTKGFRFVTIVLILGALDIALSALKLQESNDSGMSGAVDVSGANFAVDASLPAATDDNKMYAIHVDMRGRKRYLDLQVTGGDGTTGTYAAAFAVLSRPEISPSSAAERGFAAELAV